MNKLLYVTSFSEDLYKETGRRLLESFIYHQIDSPILICYENFDFKPSKPCKKFLTYPLHKSEYLNTWLDENKDIIPNYLGGEATPEKSPDIFKKLMKRKASRFFRKVASLQYALEAYGDKYDYIVWVDCDCYFIRNLPTKELIRQFRDCGVFYHQGKSRESIDAGIEAGFMGFRSSFGGYEILDQVCECFADKTFRNYRRWDDGYVFKKIIYKNTQIPSLDLTPDCIRNHPMMHSSPLRGYIRHDKGKHRRVGISI